MTDLERDQADAHQAAAPPSDDFETLAADRKRRMTRLALGGVALVAIAGGGLVALSAHQERAANERIDRAFGALSRCLTGGPLEAGETPGLRVRRAQLTAMTHSDEERIATGGAWPQRCGQLANQLHDALHDAGRKQSDDDLAHASAALGKRLADPGSMTEDLTGAVDTIWSLAKVENVNAGAAVDVAVAPAPAVPADADGLAKGTPLALKAFSFKSIYTEPHAGLDLHLLINDPTSNGQAAPPVLCTVRKPASGAPRAKCAPLPTSITGSKQGLRIFGTADAGAPPLVFAGDHGSEGAFRSDTGELVTKIYAYGGYATADGFSAVLGWREKESALVAERKVGKSDTTEAKLDPPFKTGNPYYSAQMLWDVVMLRGVTRENQRRLFALQLGRSGAVLGDPVDVGELAEPGLVAGGADEPPHINGCRTEEAMVVRVKGWDNDFMSFRLGGKWSSPISPEVTGGTLSCAGSTAAVTRIEPAPGDVSYKTTVRQAHCTSAGCRMDVLKMEQLLHRRIEFMPREGMMDAADVGGKLLVVWAAGPRGGVRMRLGPIDSIASSPDVILFDDMMKDGKVGTLSTLFDIKVFARPTYAIVLLSTSTGVHGLVVDTAGKVTPLEVEKG